MKAIGYAKKGPISADKALEQIEVDRPQLRPHDLLVEVKGISVNPVDVKVRAAVGPESGHKVIGYDAAGIVREIGSAVSKFKVGEAVYYAGDITRPGTNSEFHAVDERIVGKKPRSLDFAEAAALPLTAITAWEILFDCFGLEGGGGEGDSLLIVGAAGGVGSIMIQLAKQLTGLQVIATASRPETVEWVKQMGADHVVNHHQSLPNQLKQLGIAPRYVASLNGTDKNFASLVELIKPRGHIAIIDDPGQIDIGIIKTKALSFSWEFMFTRSMFKTDDMDAQYVLLNQVAKLVDRGKLKSTMKQYLGPLTVENLVKAHELQESGRAVGKNVLSGFE